jgi:acetylornithine deacetylase/succinyl-diaminopimelate desuccinylase-like protein
MTTDFVRANQDRFVAELSEWLRIPSVSALPAHQNDCRRAADWLVAEFKHLGCAKVELIEGDGHPVVWAEGPYLPGKPTLLIYGHYDVQPADPIHEWQTPAFEPQVRDGKLYARGTADDKGQVYALLKAYESVLDTDGVPPLNVHFLIEGEEECGGHVLSDLLAREPWRVQADVALVADMAFHAQGLPAVYTALRGMCYAEIHVRTLQRDLHSGEFGGVAPNAIETLCRLLSDLKGEDGEIRLPKLYKQVEPPTKHELRAWKKLPFDRKTFMAEHVTAKALTGLKHYTVFERLWALPTFEIHGIMGGFTGAGAKTVIPASAAAKVSLRLVPGLTYDGTLALLRKAVKKAAPKWADVEVKPVHGSDPVQVDVEHPAFAILDEAFEEVLGTPMVRKRAGGSIPIVPELGAQGAPVILTGIGLPDDGLHSPNEKLDLAQLHLGIDVFGRFFRKLGERVAAPVVETAAAPEPESEAAAQADGAA